MADNPFSHPTLSDEHERDDNGRLPARRTKLTPEAMDAITDARENGHTLGVSASKGGVSRKTIHSWMNKGSEVIEKLYDEEHPATEPTDIYAWGERYAQFYMRMTEAEAQFREELEDQILDAGFGRGSFLDEADWRALKWYAENVLGGEYSRQTEVNVTHDVGGKVEVAPMLGDGRPQPDEGMTKEKALETYGADDDDEIVDADYEVLDGETDS